MMQECECAMHNVCMFGHMIELSVPLHSTDTNMCHITLLACSSVLQSSSRFVTSFLILFCVLHREFIA